MNKKELNKLTHKEKEVIKLLEGKMLFEDILTEINKKYTVSKAELSQIIDNLVDYGILKEAQKQILKK